MTCVDFGLTASVEFTCLADEAEAPDVLVLLDANLSPLEVYGRTLIDCAVDRAIRETTSDGPVVLMSLSDSVLALSIPRELRRVSVTIDLDESYKLSEEQTLEADLFGLSGTQVEMPSRVFERLCERVERSEDMLRPLVSRLLGRCLST